MTTFAWLILLCPLVGTIVIGLGHSLLAGRSAGWIGTGAIGLSFALSVATFVALQGRSPEHRQAVSTLWDYGNTVGVEGRHGGIAHRAPATANRSICPGPGSTGKRQLTRTGS